MLEPARHAAHTAQITEDVDVVVVGAGVAGLAAARHLTGAGLRTAVLEAAPHVGGRMSTEKVDGFRLDRIGRLLSTSYPELRHTPGLDDLVLCPFSPGVLLHSDGRRHPTGTPGTSRSARGALTTARALASAPRLPLARPARGTTRPGPLGSPLDQSRLGAALARLAATRRSACSPAPTSPRRTR